MGTGTVTDGEAAVLAFDAAVSPEAGQCVAEGDVAGAKGLSESLAIEGTVGRGQGGDDALGEIGGGFLGKFIGLDNAQMGRGLPDQLQRTGWRRWSRAVLGRQNEMPIAPAEEEVAVTPGMEVA